MNPKNIPLQAKTHRNDLKRGEEVEDQELHREEKTSIVSDNIVTEIKRYIKMNTLIGGKRRSRMMCARRLRMDD